MDIFETIITRRSTRRFQEKPVEKEVLEKIVEAGRFAPSGGNSQSTRFFVITDRNVLNTLAETVEKSFAAMEVTEGMYRSMVSSIMQSKKGGYRFHYDCPALIVLANQKDYGNNIADCACANENMMIYANSIDLGSCWINQLKWLNENEEILSLFRSYGLKEDERIFAALAVGYPASEDEKPLREPLTRKGNPVHWIA